MSSKSLYRRHISSKVWNLYFALEVALLKSQNDRLEQLETVTQVTVMNVPDTSSHEEQQYVFADMFFEKTVATTQALSVCSISLSQGWTSADGQALHQRKKRVLR